MLIQISSEENILELVNAIYTDEKLKEISNLDYSIYDLNSKYPIECVRLKNDLYKVIYRGEDSFLFIYFEKDGTKESATIFKQSVTLEKLQQIDTGTNIETIMNIDNNGNYICYYTGINNPKISEHYTSDGYYVVLNYDENYNVINISTKYI